MSKHLSECFASLCECDDTHFKSIDCDFSCICPSLRACEQRVSSEFLTPMALASTGMSDPRYAKGYADGLDAAREAVNALIGWQHGIAMTAITKADALAAIDALKEKP